MGGTPSTRRVTVLNEESVGVIKVSESVIQRLKGEGQSQTVKPSRTQENTAAVTMPGPVDYKPRINALDSLQVRQAKEEEFKVVEGKWKSQVDELERQNQELYKIVTGKFNAAVTEVEEKNMQRSFAPVCDDIKNKVLKCYQDNAKLSLNCSAVVSDFLKCVDKKRNDVILSRG